MNETAEGSSDYCFRGEDYSFAFEKDGVKCTTEKDGEERFYTDRKSTRLNSSHM